MAADPKQRLIDEHGYWGEVTKYPRADWKYEVANDDTVLGYWDWVAAKEADDDHAKALSGADE